MVPLLRHGCASQLEVGAGMCTGDGAIAEAQMQKAGGRHGHVHWLRCYCWDANLGKWSANAGAAGTDARKLDASVGRCTRMVPLPRCRCDRAVSRRMGMCTGTVPLLRRGC